MNFRDETASLLHAREADDRLRIAFPSLQTATHDDLSKYVIGCNLATAASNSTKLEEGRSRTNSLIKQQVFVVHERQE